MDVTGGCYIIIPIYGVLQEWWTVRSGDCGRMVEHGCDGRHLEMLVDIDKPFPKQIAHNQCDYERNGDPFPAKFPDRVVGHHHADVQEEEQQDGKISEQNS